MAQILDEKMETYLHDCRLKMGESLKGIREKKGYSQEQLAEIMQISRSTISKIENGKKFIADFEVLGFANALKISILDLYQE